MVEIDDNNPRGLWKKVLIKSIEPSNDGLIRKFFIQDSERRTYYRPITRLIPIRIGALRVVKPAVCRFHVG